MQISSPSPFKQVNTAWRHGARLLLCPFSTLLPPGTKATLFAKIYHLVPPPQSHGVHLHPLSIRCYEYEYLGEFEVIFETFLEQESED